MFVFFCLFLKNNVNKLKDLLLKHNKVKGKRKRKTGNDRDDTFESSSCEPPNVSFCLNVCRKVKRKKHGYI